MTIVKINSSCCRLASHSFCASDSSDESKSLLSIEEGKESISSWSLEDSGEASWMMYESEVDMVVYDGGV